MASPQLKDGYTKVNHKNMEALYSANLSGSEFRVILYILRKTWGWKKPDEIIKTSTLVTETKLSKKSVCGVINKLVTKRLLFTTSIGRKKIYKFNKDHEQWKVTERLPCGHRTVTMKSPNGDPHKETKRNLLKETLKRNSKGHKCPEANEIVKYFKEVYQIKGNLPKPLENWRAAKWLFSEKGVDEIKRAILLAYNVRGERFFPAINNLMDLRDKYEQLRTMYDRRKQTGNSLNEEDY